MQQTRGDRLIRILAVTLVVSVMNATMFNIVLPQIKEEFGLTFAQVGWVTSIYTLVYAVGSALYGKLADRFALKDLLTFGVLLLSLGSVVGLVSQAFWMVLLGRMFQAAGAAVIPVTAMIIPLRYFPVERRGRALGISATGLALGTAIGPVVSSFIVSFAHWRWLFCLPVILLLTLPYYRTYLDHESGRAARIDWLGGGLLSGAVALLVLAVTQGAWLLMLGSLLLFLCFALRVRTAEEPFIQPRLFRNRQYSWGLVIAVLAVGAGYAIPFLTPQLLVDVHQLSPKLIGYVMFPAAITSALLGRRGGKLADAKGDAFLFRIACLLLLLCYSLLSAFTDLPYIWIGVFLIFGMVGQLLLQIALSNTISKTLPKEQAGVGMGLVTMLNFLSGTIAAGLFGRAVDMGAGFTWNSWNAVPGSFVYSNIYMVIVLIDLLILVLYSFQYGRVRKSRGKVGAAALGDRPAP
nr:MFS transporter [Paenibacillus sp. J31TS4]